MPLLDRVGLEDRLRAASQANPRVIGLYDVEGADLGKGNYGRVRLGRHVLTGDKVGGRAPTNHRLN